MKALILLAPGKSPDAVLELEDLPAVGSHLSAAGNTYEIVRVGHAFDLDASGRLIHTVELDARRLDGEGDPRQDRNGEVLVPR